MRNCHKILFVLIILANAISLSAQKSQNVLVASHRGDWRNFPENTIEAINGAIAMGVDIVEIDIAKTKDGHYILMHDNTVERTTNGHGLVKDKTLEEIHQLKLRNGLRMDTDFRIPTLMEAMLAVKGKNVLVNLDKADEHFDDVYRILLETGTIDQTIIKSDKPYDSLCKKYGDNFHKMRFMPVIPIGDNTTIEKLDFLLDKKFPMYEIVFSKVDEEMLEHIKVKAKKNTSLIWINSLWASLCGGYNDDKALTDPDGTWGLLINKFGAGILQTDRPAYMIDYLKQKNLRD